MTAAALVVTAGVGLEAWAAVDRVTAASAGPSRIARSRAGLVDLEAKAREHPTPVAYAELARAEAAAGHAAEAASAALTASRLAPDNATMAATAENYVDSAFRAHVRGVVRPFAGIGAALLVLSFFLAAHRRRDERRRDAILANARGRIVLSVEGDGEARADTATLRPPGTKALVIDVHGDSTLASLRKPPPLVVALTNSQAGRTVRLAPKKDAAGGAARFRLTGDALREVLARPGKWRVLVRAGGALLAEGSVRVEPRMTVVAA
jgi:hypothetical protein